MMEQRYRHMMEQVNMDEEFEADLLERIREGRPKRRPRPLRTALIAACVCLILTGTAVAAGGGIFDFVEKLLGNSRDAHYDVIPEIIRYPIVTFSKELQLWTQENDSEATKYFDSFQEMEDFSGIELYNNSVLSMTYKENINVLTFEQNEDGLVESIGYTTNYSIDGTILSHTTNESEDMDTAHITVGAILYTENTEVLPVLTYHQLYEDNIIELSRENYLTPSGLPVVIVTGKTNESDLTVEILYSAHFVLRGMNYFVVSSGSDVELQTLKTVLDAFE